MTKLNRDSMVTLEEMFSLKTPEEAARFRAEHPMLADMLEHMEEFLIEMPPELCDAKPKDLS